MELTGGCLCGAVPKLPWVSIEAETEKLGEQQLQ